MAVAVRPLSNCVYRSIQNQRIPHAPSGFWHRAQLSKTIQSDAGSQHTSRWRLVVCDTMFFIPRIAASCQSAVIGLRHDHQLEKNNPTRGRMVFFEWCARRFASHRSSGRTQPQVLYAFGLFQTVFSLSGAFWQAWAWQCFVDQPRRIAQVGLLRQLVSVALRCLPRVCQKTRRVV